MDAEPGGLLALDLSSTTGWAYGHDGRDPTAGVWNLGPYSLGRRASSFANVLEQAFAMFQPRLVIMEAPLPPQRQTAAASCRIQYGLAAVAEMICFEREVPIEEARADDVRKLVIGRNRWPKGETKAAVMAWCRSQGWEPVDDNAADAMVLWRYRHMLRRPRAAA